MKLPNAARGLVEYDKIVSYLMNPTHPEGAGKAGFFQALGFQREEWQLLAEALLLVAVEGNVEQVIESIHGSKYIVDGVLLWINGRRAIIRTVWIMEWGSERPRLVTAYPKEE